MLTLSYGYKKPQTNDKGPIVFPALEGNIQRLNDHTHDGANSAKLPSTSLSPSSATLLAGAWTLVGDGLYKQTVTLPSGITYDNAVFTVKLATSGDIVHPTIEKVSATQYDIYTNDNTEGFVVVYL